MINNCPVCGKAFDVLWPHLWRYKIGNNYFCRWTCFRAAETGKKEIVMKKSAQPRARMTREEMDTAMRIWRDGGDLDAYLKAHGITNIAKWKMNAKNRRPAEVPAEDPVRPQLPEEPAEEKPRKKYKTTGIRSEEFGEFYFDKKYNSIDWRTDEGEEISLSPVGWLNLAAELPDILSELGVEV